MSEPRGRLAPAAPAPADRPLRLLVTTLINDNFLQEILERYRGHAERGGPFPGPVRGSGDLSAGAQRQHRDGAPARRRVDVRGQDRGVAAAAPGLGRHRVRRLVPGHRRAVHAARPGDGQDHRPAAQLRGVQLLAAPGGLLPGRRRRLRLRAPARPVHRGAAAAHRRTRPRLWVVDNAMDLQRYPGPSRPTPGSRWGWSGSARWRRIRGGRSTSCGSCGSTTSGPT
ncbi:hypothetical protein V2I01_27555 [Micromonospora sp. BRA006-A]|nr:hypothetical protein [Micromonospora sp. BRA006-A]